MGKSNQELLKALTTQALQTGGQLTPERQNAYFVLVRTGSKFLSMIRTERRTQKSGMIDKIMQGEPITEEATENVASDRNDRPSFGQVEYNTKKTRSKWNITFETLQENIVGKNLDAVIATMMTARIADDMELLGIQGNEALVGTTPQAKLLKTNNGFDKITDSAHLLDCNGATISSDIFYEMLRRMPQQYKKDTSRLRFFCANTLKIDYCQTIASRNTSLGDMMLQQTDIKTGLGIPLIDIPYIPADKDLVVGTAIAGKTIGNRQAPFEIETGVNDKLKITVDQASYFTVTLAPPVFTAPMATQTKAVLDAVDICGQINAAAIAATGVGKPIASTDGFGRIVLTSPTKGASSQIILSSIANDAYTTLGLTAATYSGGAAAASNVVKEGTFIWLADPQNFIHVLQEGTRVYSKYNQDNDRFETTNYNQNDYVVENLDAIVKATNVRTNALGRV